MKLFFRFVLGLSIVVLIALAVLFNQSQLRPLKWQPAPRPELTGIYSPNSYLQDFERIEFTGSHGPEDTARNSAGNVYTGLNDGRILQFDPSKSRVSEVINTGGRPLGLMFDKEDNLIIADGMRGLLMLTPAAEFSVLTDTAEGVRMKFVDALDIANDGTIWFSDASMRYGMAEYGKDFLEASATGRLLSYSPQSKETQIQMEGLYFANGVALGPNDEFVLVTETGTGRIHRLWLKGSQTGRRDIFHPGLPGNPDNLSFNGIDTFWVAMPSVRKAVNESLSNQLMLRRILGALPGDWFVKPQQTGFIVGLNLKGEVSHVVLQNESSFSSITSVHEWDNRLYLGSLTMDHIAIIAVPPAVDPVN